MLSVAERRTKRKLSELPQTNRMSLWGCCGMNCKATLAWYEEVIVPFVPHVPSGATADCYLSLCSASLHWSGRGCRISLPGRKRPIQWERRTVGAFTVEQKCPRGKTYQVTPAQLYTDLSSKCMSWPCSYVAYMCTRISLVGYFCNCAATAARMQVLCEGMCCTVRGRTLPPSI